MAGCGLIEVTGIGFTISRIIVVLVVGVKRSKRVIRTMEPRMAVDQQRAMNQYYNEALHGCTEDV